MNDITFPELSKSSSVKEATLFIDKSIRKTAEQILETGYGFYVLQEACKREDINFSEVAQERYKLSKSAVSKWVKIGSKYRELFQYRNLLPTNYSTIYSLLTLPKKAFNEVIEDGELHPALSFEDAERIKKAYKADEKAKKQGKVEEDTSQNPFSDENLLYSEDSSETDNQKEANQQSFSDKTGLNDPIEAEFKEVKEKPSKKKKKPSLTVFEALERLEINLDDAFILAKKAGRYNDDQLLEAMAVLRGE